MRCPLVGEVLGSAAPDRSLVVTRWAQSGRGEWTSSLVMRGRVESDGRVRLVISGFELTPTSRLRVSYFADDGSEYVVEIGLRPRHWLPVIWR